MKFCATAHATVQGVIFLLGIVLINIFVLPVLLPMSVLAAVGISTLVVFGLGAAAIQVGNVVYRRFKHPPESER